MIWSSAVGSATENRVPVVVSHDLEPARGQARTAAHDIGRLRDVGGPAGPPGLRVGHGRVLVSDDRRDASPRGTADLGSHGVRLVLEVVDPGVPSPAGPLLPGDVLGAHGPGIATVLSHLGCPSRQPAVVCVPVGGPWSGYLVVMLWELLGVSRVAMLGQFARVAQREPSPRASPPAGRPPLTTAVDGRGPVGTTAPSSRDLGAELDEFGGLDRWWATTGEPSWVPEALRLTLLERLPATP